MKILQVIPAFYPARAYGGTVEVSFRISSELVRRGHEVTVYTSDSLDKYHRHKSKILEIDGIKVYYFRNFCNRLAWNHRLFFNPGMLPILRKEINSFNIIHLHGHYNFLNIATYYFASRYNIPYVHQAHGSVLPIFQKRGLKNIFNLFFGYRILKNAFKVIALTKTEAEQYKKMGVDENKIEIVPNGIDLSEYENLPDRGVFRGKYGIKSNEKIVLYLGRIHKNKGVNLLIDAFSDISKELNDIRLVLIGPNDGHQQFLVEHTKKLEINDKVLFTGFVKDEEKISAFVDADVFITPSYSGFPITFLEACACGTPIITTNNGDELEWIHDKVGYVVEYDKEQLRDAMFKILSDYELRQRFGEEGKRLVREEFEWNKIVKFVEKIYEAANK